MAAVSDELAWWLDVLHTADDIFDALPVSVRDEIEAGESPRELARMAVALAGLSTATRRAIEDTIVHAMGNDISRPVGRGQTRLRLVGQAGA